MARYGRVWLMRFGKARLGKVGYGLVRSGMAYVVRYGKVGRGSLG